MTLEFTKMHGAGNDFVMIDNMEGTHPIEPDTVARICDRHFGVGADGVLLLEKPPAEATSLHARMVYYNADGSRAEMCGNGARCFTAFALSRGLGDGKILRFLTDAGTLSATAANGLYTIEMTPPRDTALHREIPLKEGLITVHYSDTGVPHIVQFVDDVASVDIRPRGAELRFHPAFAPRGANVNFAEIQPNGPILIRTYERGVEDETLACGTGVTAVAILAHLVHGVPRPVAVQVKGGDVLSVDFEGASEYLMDKVTLTGPAKVVFTGKIDL